MATRLRKTHLSKPIVARSILTLILFLLPHICSAADRSMPPIDAKTLAGEMVKLPGTASSKPVVLVFGFSKAARSQGESWGKGLIALQHQKDDFNFFQVAVIGGAPRFTYSLITRAMRAAIPQAYHQHTLVLTDDERKWRDLLGVTDDAFAYVVLCNAAGAVEWQAKGAGPVQFAELRLQLRREGASER